jgi:hypothetical protein
LRVRDPSSSAAQGSSAQVWSQSAALPQNWAASSQKQDASSLFFHFRSSPSTFQNRSQTLWALKTAHFWC